MCNHPLHTTSEKKTTNQPNRALWSSDTKTFGKSVIEGPFFKKKHQGGKKVKIKRACFHKTWEIRVGVGIWKLGSEELSVRSITTSWIQQHFLLKYFQFRSHKSFNYSDNCFNLKSHKIYNKVSESCFKNKRLFKLIVYCNEIFFEC